MKTARVSLFTFIACATVGGGVIGASLSRALIDQRFATLPLCISIGELGPAELEGLLQERRALGGDR